jgi:hypothetical protein
MISVSCVGGVSGQSIIVSSHGRCALQVNLAPDA